MNIGYVILTVSALAYIIMCKEMDLFLFSILCSTIYFLPNLFGVVLLYYESSWITEPIVSTLYITHLLFMLIMFLFHLFKRINSLQVNEIKDIEPIDNLIYADADESKTSFVIACTSYVLMLLILRENIFSYKTTTFGGLFEYFRVFHNFIVIYSFFISYKTKSKLFLILQIPFLLTTFIQGHRSYIVFVMVAIVINELIINKIKLRNPKILLSGSFLAIFGFLGKSFLAAIRNGRGIIWAFERVFNMENILYQITHSEPFVTQYIFNKTVLLDVKLPISYVSRYIQKAFFISPSIFSGNQSFYTYFNEVLFPNLNYGIGYNIFAEPYAIGRLWGVLVFILLYGILLHFLDKNIKSDNVLLSSLILIIASIFTFYMYRNRLENLILWAQVLIIIYILYSLSIRIVKNKKQTIKK